MMGTSDETKELVKGTFRSYENCVYLAGACNVGKTTLASILIGEKISTDGLNICFGRNGIDLKKKEMVPLKLKLGSDGDVLSKVLKNGTYEIDIAPSDLVDFGGERSFDMTHQLFMRHKGTFVLMFNGTIKLLQIINDERETTESNLIHWVNSILSYCVYDDDDDEDILPIILFCATHSDEFNQKDHEDTKKKLIHDLRKIFKDHKQKDRIRYKEMFFIDGQNKKDPEINKLKSKLVEVALKQKSWGKRMPMAWVPLELQMSDLRFHNMNIISKEELMTLNQRNEDLKLSVEQIKVFLNVQHSLGKILYFDQQGLDNFIIVQPQSLVHILRSFITAECFWPKNEELRFIICTLTNTGGITKQNLRKLWSQKKFHQHMPNDEFKEFIIRVLVHLDILVEQRHYGIEQESEVQSYLVPCMVKRRPPKIDDKSTDKMICLSYTLLKSSIPAALSFKLIGAAMNVWPLKETSEGICLYQQAAILCIDDLNELHLSVKDNKVFAYLINKEEKDSISQNHASMIQECLTLTMTKVLEFYHKPFGKLLSTFEVSKVCELKVGEWCPSEGGCSEGGCYISVPEVKINTTWKCTYNRTHHTKFPRYWIYNKKQVKCKENCSGLYENQLAIEPKEKDFMRLANLITTSECQDVVVKLELTHVEWEDILNKTTYDSLARRFLAFCYWKNKMAKNLETPTYQQLSDAFKSIKVKQKHPLCQLFMENTTVVDIANSALQEIPEDDVLLDLSKQFTNGALHLGVELELPMATIEEILFKNEKSYFGQNRGVMEEWKRSKKPGATILVLMEAFQHVDGKGVTFLAQKYGIKLKDQ